MENNNLCENYISEYLEFLTAKTEREVFGRIKEYAENSGFEPFEKIKDKIGSKELKGTKIYFTNEEKNIALVILGEKPIKDGLHIIASHIDSPRLDLKPKPIYERNGLVFFNTQYYGGIKKHQWTCRALDLKGVVVKHGKKIRIDTSKLGINFEIPEILPHLDTDNQGKNISGEALDPVVGNMTKKEFLDTLKDLYGIEESDFYRAELELVPSADPSYVSLDKKLIGAYGQDDRICAFAQLKAIIDVDKVPHTAISIFYDKEEIGSDGRTGAKSVFFKKIVKDIISLYKRSDKSFESICMKSKAISADVNSAYNPLFSDKFDLDNSAFLGKGPIIGKYNGMGGKYDTSDASAEYLDYIISLCEKEKIPYQVSAGKVDTGGGGTIAKFLAEQGIEIVDIGPGILGMHSPREIANKYDAFNSYRMYKSFFSAC
jgi:aspartyl aminopeptidase